MVTGLWFSKQYSYIKQNSFSLSARVLHALYLVPPTREPGELQKKTGIQKSDPVGFVLSVTEKYQISY